MQSQKHTSISINTNSLTKHFTHKLKPTQIPLKNFIGISPYNSNSNSYRQGKFKTAKASPEKNLNSININNEEITTEVKEIRTNTLEFIRKKFQKKKHSNYLNYTNPINKSNKIISNRPDEITTTITKTHAPNSNSASVNNSVIKTTTNTKSKQTQLNNYETDIKHRKLVISPRDTNNKSKKKPFITNNNNNGVRGTSSNTNSKQIHKITNDMKNSNNSTTNKTIECIYPRKKIAQTAFNSRKNSTEKKIRKIYISKHNSNSKLQYIGNNNNDNINNTSTCTKINTKIVKHNKDGFSLKNNIKLNTCTPLTNINSLNSSLTFKISNTNIMLFKKQKIPTITITTPLSKASSKTNSKPKLKIEHDKPKSQDKPSQLMTTNPTKEHHKRFTKHNKNKHDEHIQTLITHKQTFTKKQLSKTKDVKPKSSKNKQPLTILNNILTNPIITTSNTTTKKINIKYASYGLNKKTSLSNDKQHSISKTTKTNTKHNRNISPQPFITNNNNNNTMSLLSTIRDANYYQHECEMLSEHIKTYYQNNKEYPKTDLSFYKYGRIIGRGAFGKVNIGLNILTGRVVAIKSFNKQNISNFTSEEKIRKETNLMRNLRHPSITKILEMFESEKYVLIIMEYISGGNLQSFVKKRRKLNEKTAKILFKQIMEGIKYIHSKNIVHRDIKLENILIDLNNNIKICDFGVSKRIHSNSILEDQCGTPVYMAPEIIKNEGYKGFPVDIWSAGVSLYLMLSGNIPFNKTSKHTLQEDILNSTYPPITGISNEADDLLRGLLDKNPSTRLTVDEVLVHPWLRDEEFDKNTKLNLNKYHLFTNAEMVLLSKTHIDYRKAALCDLEENFTMENLITKDEENTHNANTRSIILAPFNTMFSENDIDLNDSCYDVNNSIPKEFGVMRYCGKIKELNLNYELNFNEEMDNGILINSQYDICNRSEEINNSKINESEYVFKGDNNKRKVDIQFERYPNKANYNGNNNNLSDSTAENSNNVFVVNENIVGMVSKLGYRREDVLKWLDKNELNQATTAYYLLLNYESVK